VKKTPPKDPGTLTLPGMEVDVNAAPAPAVGAASPGKLGKKLAQTLLQEAPTAECVRDVDRLLNCASDSQAQWCADVGASLLIGMKKAQTQLLWFAILMSIALNRNVFIALGFESWKAFATDLLSRSGHGISPPRLNRLPRAGALWQEIAQSPNAVLPNSVEPLIALLPAEKCTSPELRPVAVWTGLAQRLKAVPSEQAVREELRRLGITRSGKPKAKTKTEFVTVPRRTVDGFIRLIDRALVQISRGGETREAERTLRSARSKAQRVVDAESDGKE